MPRSRRWRITSPAFDNDSATPLAPARRRRVGLAVPRSGGGAAACNRTRLSQSKRVACLPKHVRPFFISKPHVVLGFPAHVDRFHFRAAPEDLSPRAARRGRIVVLDALRDRAADGDLHRQRDRHRAQAERAVSQLRQPVRAVLGRCVPHAVAAEGLRFLVVPADPGLFGGVDQPLPDPQRAQDGGGHALVEGPCARAQPARLPSPRRIRRRAPAHRGGEPPVGAAAQPRLPPQGGRA